jgi:hypothetical protein
LSNKFTFLQTGGQLKIKATMECNLAIFQGHHLQEHFTAKCPYGKRLHGKYFKTLLENFAAMLQILSCDYHYLSKFVGG